MNLTERIASFKKSDQFTKFKSTAALRLFGLTKVPLIFLVNPKVRELNAKKCVIEIPLNRITKNHWGSMYFGTLAIGADCAAGLFAMYKADQLQGIKFSIVFKDFKANFLKRPESNVAFVCTDHAKIDDMLAEAKKTGERVTRGVKIEGRLPKLGDELVAEFELGLSLKVQKK